MKIFFLVSKYTILLITLIAVIVMFTNIESLLTLQFDNFYIYIISTTIYIFIYYLFFRNKLVFYENLTHELTHLLFALITFKKLTVLHVAIDSGLVQYEGRKNFIVTLSPYFYPFVTVIIILISTVLPKDYLILCNVLICISYTSFLLRLFHDFSLKQPDIIESGSVFSAVFICLTNLIIFIFVLHIVSNDNSEFLNLFNFNNLQNIFKYG